MTAAEEGHGAAARLHAAQAEQALMRDDAGTALALAVEAADLAPGSVEAERVLNAALASLRERHVLSGHTYRVAAAQFSPDGAQVVTADHDGVVRIWDAASGARLTRIETKTSQLAAMAVSPDAARLVTAPGYGGVAKLFDLATGAEIAALEGPGTSMRIARFTPDGARIVTGGYAQALKVWDGATGAPLGAFKKHADTGKVHITSLDFAPESGRVASGDSAGRIWVWRVDATDHATVLEGHQRDVRGLSFSPDGAQLLSLGWGDAVRLWDLRTGAMRRQWEGGFRSACFSPDGARIATAGAPNDPGAVGLWDAETGVSLARLPAPDGAVLAVAFDAEGRRVLGRTTDHALLWDLSTGRIIARFVGHGAPGGERLNKALLSPDGATVLTTGEYGLERVAPDPATARLWSVEHAAAPWVRLSLTHPDDDADATARRRISDVVVSADGAHAAAWTRREAAVWLWRLASGEVRLLEGHEKDVVAVAFSPDGDRAGSVDSGGQVRLWDLSTGDSVLIHETDYAARSVVFRPDGAALSIELEDDVELVIRDLDAGGVLARVEDEALADRPARYFVWSPDGRFLLGSDDSRDGSSSFLFDLQESAFISNDVSGAIDVQGRLFSPDGARLLTASDGVVRLTASESGETLAEIGWFSPHSTFGSVSFSPDGGRIVTAGPDEAVWIRDGATGAVVQIMRDYGAVSSAYFSPDGERLVIARRDGAVRLLARGSGAPERWREIAAFDGLETGLGRRARFTPDGLRILAWASGVLQVSPAIAHGASLADRARRLAPRCLSVEERRRFGLPAEPPRWCVTGPEQVDSDPKAWRPRHPYRDQAWVAWLAARDGGEASAPPQKPTER